MRPTLVMIPCFAGAPWDLTQLTHLGDWPMRTLRLPDDLNDIDAVADFVLENVHDLDTYVLVGDSYGAVISIALATRQPAALRGLVVSGGFARNPITSPVLKALAALAPYFPGPFYRSLTLRVHAANLRSAFDAEGEIPWSTRKTREFFLHETPHKAYVNRVHSIQRADYVARLPRISVPTLILTPEEDRLIGKDACQIMLAGIRGAEEVVMPRTGHMFRFSHPGAYSLEVRRFLERRILGGASENADQFVVGVGRPQAIQGRWPGSGPPTANLDLTRAGIRSIVVGVVAACSAEAALANNGYNAHGFGVKASGMGGVGIALPQDSIAAAINPAGLGFVGDRLDIEGEWRRASRGATISGSPLPINGDYDGNRRSDFFVPAMGYVHTLSPTMTLGISLVGSGLNTSYTTPIPLFGTSKATSNLTQVFLAPSFAYKVASDHMLGIALNLVQQRLKVEGLENFTGTGSNQASQSPGNVTNRGEDSAYGLGVRLGYIGRVTPWLMVGATYQTKTSSGKFDKYRGLIPRQGAFDIPANYGVGVSAKPSNRSTVALDVVRIRYSGIPTLANPLSRLTIDGQPLGSDNGAGFGWRDVTAYKLGIDYAVMPQWTLRAGYNYGKQPITPGETFFNMLAPVTTERHYTLGTTWIPNHTWELSFFYMYAPEGRVMGRNSIPMAFGGGEADIRLRQQAIGVAFGWKF
ncbi:MAG: alpha/beta fold hydrolase [Rhodocyclaceae bacterium]|nr:alpha/beta fold hydrolase [Rhodocyclaceae bacterium]